MRLRRDCRHEAEILAYLSREQTGSEAARTEEHLRECEICQRARREILALQQLLDSDPPVEAPVPSWPAVESRLRGSRKSGFRLRWTLGTVTAAALGVWIGFVVGNQAPVPQADPGYPLWSTLGSSLSNQQSTLVDVYGETSFEGVVR